MKRKIKKIKNVWQKPRMGPVPNHSFRSAAKIPIGFPIASQHKRRAREKGKDQPH